MRTITVVDPKVKPVGKRGKKYVYRVNKFKGCYVLTNAKVQRDGAFALKEVKCPPPGKAEPRLLAYGTFNVYEKDGKAYYKWGKKFVRAEERDFLIKR